MKNKDNISELAQLKQHIGLSQKIIALTCMSTLP